MFDVAAERVVRLLVHAGLVPALAPRGGVLMARRAAGRAGALGLGHAWPPTLARCAAPPRSRASTSCASSAGRSASSTSAWRRRRCSSGPGARSTSGATPGWLLGWASRTATRIARPIRRGPWLVPARCWWRRGRTSPTTSRARPADGVPARVARYAWVDHYAPLREGLRAMARRLRAADERAVAFADDNAIVDREVAHRAGLGWFGKNANLLLPGAGSWFVLGCVITTAALPGRRRARRRRLRHVPSVPRRLPDGRHRGARRHRRQPLPRLGAATPGCHPGRAPSGGR